MCFGRPNPDKWIPATILSFMNLISTRATMVMITSLIAWTMVIPGRANIVEYLGTNFIAYLNTREVIIT